MCCAIAALLFALFPAWPGGRDALMRFMGSTRRMAFVAAGGVVLAGGTAFAAGFNAPAAQHICSILTGF